MSMPMHRLLVSASSAIVALAGGHSSNGDITSTFESTDEGWVAQGDVAVPVTWTAAGGNPRGHVQVVDSVSGGVMYFVAPAKFRGDRSSSYGRLLRFDLRQSYTGAANQFDDRDLILVGGGLTLVFDTAQNPTNGAWSSYSVPLAPGGWRITSLGGAIATEAQIRAALASVTSLSIRAEYQTGSDTDSLDNVVLEECPSEDLDGDGLVSAADLSILLLNWGTPDVADIDCDGVVGATDLSRLLLAWSS
jgi:hypothetical protein